MKYTVPGTTVLSVLNVYTDVPTVITFCFYVFTGFVSGKADLDTGASCRKQEYIYYPHNSLTTHETVTKVDKSLAELCS